MDEIEVQEEQVETPMVTVQNVSDKPAIVAGQLLLPGEHKRGVNYKLYLQARGYHGDGLKLLGDPFGDEDELEDDQDDPGEGELEDDQDDPGDNVVDPIKGRTFHVAGSFEVSQSHIKNSIIAAGGAVAEEFGDHVDVLIVGRNPGDKVTQAENSEIWTEKQLNERL
jgi:NAD-dependent DNA ligase